MSCPAAPALRITLLAAALSAAWPVTPAHAQSATAITPVTLAAGAQLVPVFAPRLSADGDTWVGNYMSMPSGQVRGFIWRRDAGMQDLSREAVDHTMVTGISGDASRAVGLLTTNFGVTGLPVVWDLSANTHEVLTLPGTVSSAKTIAISTDGLVIGGTAEFNARPGVEIPMRWTLGGAPESLDPAQSWGPGAVYALNQDGSVAVGAVQSASGPGPATAFRWTPASGIQDLGGLNGVATATAIAYDVNAAGDVVVGAAPDNGLPGTPLRAFRWTEDAGMKSLGVLDGGSQSMAYGVNAAGDVVVGSSTDGGSPTQKGFRWTQETGMQTVEQWLRSKGVDVAESGPYVSGAYDVSANGEIVAGTLSDGSGFVARVVDPPPTDDGGGDDGAGDDDGQGDGGDSGGGNGGGKPPAPPETGPGSGLINLSNFYGSLAGASVAADQALQDVSMVMMGAHGNPMRGLVSRGQQYVWTTGDWGRSDVSDSEHANVGAIEIGYARGLGGTAMVKVAVGRTYSEQDTVYGGDVRTRGTYILPEFIAAIPRTPLYGTLSAYYNDGDADVKRGYLNAGRQVHSTGSTSVDTWGVQGRLDWLDAVKAGRLSLTPYAAVLYTKAHLGGYTERHGGFPVRWDARQQTSTLARLGIDAVYDLSDSIKLLGRIEGVHRFEDHADSATGEILGLNTFDLDGQRYKQNWMRLGAGIEAGIGKGTLSVYGNATTEAETGRYWVSVGYRLPF